MAQNPTVLQIKAKIDGLKGLNQLKASLRKIGTEAVNSQNVLKGYTAEIVKFSQKTGNSINALEAQKRAFEALRRSVDITSDEFKQAGIELEKLDKKLAKAEGRKPGTGRLRSAAQSVGAIAGAGVFGGPEGAIGAALGAFGGPAGAIVGGAIGAQVGQLRQALGATAEYAAELKKLRVALQGVTTSNEEYANAIQAIRGATKDYAIPQEVLTRQFTKLQASVQGAGGNINDTKTAFNGIVAAVRATGGSLQDVDSALTATAQVFSKGKVSAEELRQQIGERLPGAFSIFAQSIGKTPQELDKALEKGQVSLQDFQTFSEALFKRYGENAKIIASGPESAGDRLKVALSELSESVGTLLAPIGTAFLKVFTEIVKAISSASTALSNFLGIGTQGAINKAKREFELAEKGFTDSGLRFRDPESLSRREKNRYNRLKNAFNLAKSRLSEAEAAGELADIQRPTEGSGLPGITLDEGGEKTKKGRTPVDKRPAAIEKLRKLMLGITREFDSLQIAAYEVGATQAELILVKAAQATKVAREQEEDRLRVIKEVSDITGQVYSQEIAQVKELTQARLGLATAVKNQELFELRLSKLGMNRESFDRTSKVYTNLDQQQFPTGIESILNPSKISVEINALKDSLKELVDPVNQVIGAAKTIGTAFSQSFTDAISGSKSAKEALADFFQSVGSYFLDMAGQIIAKMITISILNSIAKVLPGSGGGSGFNLAGFGNIYGADSGISGGIDFINSPNLGIGYRANGGPVSANTPYIVGERGPELMVPSSSGMVLSNSATRQQLAQQGSAMRSTEATRQQLNTQRNTMITNSTRETERMTEMMLSNPDPIDVRYESTVINNVEYVTVEQHRQGMAQAAERGRSLTLSALQGSVKTRKKVGLS